MSTENKSSAEDCFSRALAAENAGDAKKADMWLKLAVKREQEAKDAATATA